MPVAHASNAPAGATVRIWDDAGHMVMYGIGGRGQPHRRCPPARARLTMELALHRLARVKGKRFRNDCAP